MSMIVGTTGLKIYAITSVDVSTNTSLIIKAVPPSGEDNTKDFTATIDAVGFASVTLEDGTASGAVAANESMYYELANTTDLDEAGIWKMVGVWTDTVSNKIIKGLPFTMEVLDDSYG